MTKILLIIVFVVLVFFGSFYFLNKTTATRSGQNLFTKGTINFGTQEFSDGSPIPVKFTCEGKDINPTLYIERVPGDAKSLVVVMEDINTVPKPFTHWIMFNIPSETTIIEEGGVPLGAIVATNDFGQKTYSGPCPTVGVHKYFFRVYALDTILTLTSKAKIEEVKKEIKGHVITTGETFGEFAK